jgi:hypothetical protein
MLSFSLAVSEMLLRFIRWMESLPRMYCKQPDFYIALIQTWLLSLHSKIRLFLSSATWIHTTFKMQCSQYVLEEYLSDCDFKHKSFTVLLIAYKMAADNSHCSFRCYTKKIHYLILLWVNIYLFPVWVKKYFKLITNSFSNWRATSYTRANKSLSNITEKQN